jgi:iron(III) transport system permease protein
LTASRLRVWPRLLLGGWTLFLLVFVAFPLISLFLKCFQDRDGQWIGLANVTAFATSSSLGQAVSHSLTVAAWTTALTLALAFPFAFGLTRTRMRGKGIFRIIAQIPLLAPSLLPALSMVYLFGNKGIVRDWMLGHSIYGPIGIVMASVFSCFPHAVLILTTALSVSDARLYESARSLGANSLRRFLTITLPGAQYGLVNAGFVVFTMALTDFGIPKVLGGQYSVLATEVFDQVVGLQDFGMGAVVGMVLLLPVTVAFFAERWGAKRQKALLSSRATLYEPPRGALLSGGFFAFCTIAGLLLLGVLAMAAVVSFITFWPYNLQLTLRNYAFSRFDSVGWDSYWHSLQLAGWTAVAGTALMFGGAYLTEKLPATRGSVPVLKGWIRLLAMLPLGVPGMVLGLSYIFFFNHPANPLSGIYGTMAILVLSTCIHFYSVGHLTALTALKQLDGEYEAVSASLKAPLWRTFWVVTVPLCLPAILDIALYLFVNAMTTVSAVVFLYTPDTKPASVAILNMDDSGAVAAAAALSMVIVYSSTVVRLLHVAVEHVLLRRTQLWRRP